MAFNDITDLKELGFVGFLSIGELILNSSVLPEKRGVYCIINSLDCKPNFLESGCGGYFKGKNPNLSLSALSYNWVDGAIVIYIGKAGGQNKKATLRSRLRQYLKFGQGKPVGHWGGRLIWQLKNPSSLIICWKDLPDQEPREYEAELIKQFISKFGKRPFANLAD